MLSRSRFRIHAVLAIGVFVVSVASASVVAAQRESSVKPAKPKALPKVVQALDRWVVTRFRNAQLLPDSTNSTRTPMPEALPPRVESVGDAVSADTLYALHFDDRRDQAALRIGTQARLTGPSGSITAITAEIVARRPFRAPRVPGADTTSKSGWRFGWAYLAIVRPPHASASAEAYRGWLLLNAPDTTRR